MKIATCNKKISDVFERFQIHPLFGLRLITYPLTALSTFLNLWLISSKYSNALFNLFLVAWMLTGTIQVLEYALGVEVMNSVAIAGFQRTIIQKVYRNILALFIILLVIYLVVRLPVMQARINIYLKRFSSNPGYDTQLLISIFFLVLFLSGSYQLLSRVLLGLRMNVSAQLAGLFGYILSSALLLTYMTVAEHPSFSISFCLGLSPIAISIIPAFFLVSHLKPLPDVGSVGISKKFTGVHYSTIYLVVSLLSTFNVYFPRVMTSLKGFELTRYLMTFTIIGIFINISSSMSQLLWVENLKQYPNKATIIRRYRRALSGSFYSLPFFILTSLFLYTVYSNLGFDRQMLGLISLSFLFFIVQNIHMISSSLMLSKKDLGNACLLLLLHNIFLVLLSRSEGETFSATSYLFILITSSILINFLPSLVLVKRKTSHET